MSANSRRTIRLTERVATTCRLALDDVDYLCTEHRRHIEVRPTRCRDKYQLVPRGYVGTIVTPGYHLHIRPKIRWTNFFHLLALDDLNLSGEQHGKRGEIRLLDVLAQRLVGRLQERLAQGLHREYREQRQQGTFLQGRLDVPAQMRQGPARQHRLACHVDEFTADVLINQLPKTTVEQLLHTDWLDDQTRRKLQAMLPAFDDVTSLPSGPCPEVPLNRLTEAYRPLLDLCRLLWNGLAPSPRDGVASYPTFLVSLENVFEAYGTRAVQSYFAEHDRYRVEAQLSCTLYPRSVRQPDWRIRPDVLVFRDDKLVFVIDLKWKTAPLVRADFYQMLSYCAALGCGQGLLVYPGSHNQTWSYPLADNAFHILLRKLRVTGSTAQCETSLRQLLQFIERNCDT